MIQRFDEKDFQEEKALNVFMALIDPFKLAVDEFTEEYANSRELALAIYMAHASPLFEVFDDKYRFETLMNPYTQALIYLRGVDPLIELVQVATGGEVRIDVPAPAVVYINSTEGNSNLFWNRDDRPNIMEDGSIVLGDPVLFTTDNSEDGEPGIVFEVPFRQYSAEGFSRILSSLMAPGFYLRYGLVYII